MDWANWLLEGALWLWNKLRGERREALKEQVLERMQAVERQKRATQAIFQTAQIAQLAGMSPRRIRPLLRELEREERIFQDRLVTMGYSLRPMPWNALRMYGGRI